MIQVKDKWGFWIIGKNRWDKTKFSKEQAIEASKTLIKCTSCVNCTKCVQCSGCTNCHNCTLCRKSINLHGCIACKDCGSEGRKCIGSINCVSCFWVTRLVGGIDVHGSGGHYPNYIHLMRLIDTMHL